MTAGRSCGWFSPRHRSTSAVCGAGYAEWLDPLGLDGDDQDDVILAVNEAAANCVDHAYPAGSPGSMTMTCWTEPGLLFVEIADDGAWRTPTAPANGRGHGIHLMRRLVDDVGIRHDRHGTRVLLRCRTTATPTGEAATTPLPRGSCQGLSD